MSVMKDRVKHRGVVIDTLPGTMFRVRLVDGREVICALGGKLFINHIRVILGDDVDVALSPDGSRGRIERRFINGR